VRRFSFPEQRRDCENNILRYYIDEWQLLMHCPRKMGPGFLEKDITGSFEQFDLSSSNNEGEKLFLLDSLLSVYQLTVSGGC
jgi:hypothetical protein